MSLKILLADDSITIQKVVGIIFGGDEYALTVVDNGKAAVEKAQEICPDVLLIDALMPGMSGYEACQAIRSNPALAAKPILILTGSFEPFDENKARECGADDFLAKPFESQQIVGKVKELVALGASRATAAPAAAPQPAPAAPVAPPAAPAAPAFVAEPAPAPPVAPAAAAPAEPAQEVSFGDISFEEPPAAPPAFTPEPAPAFGFEEQSPFETLTTPPAAPVAPQAAPVAEPADIWGAFTAEEPAAPVAAPQAAPAAAPETAPQEPDVFAMVSEEAETTFAAPAETEHVHHTGSQWIPVEEQTFEFVEEHVADIPATALTEPVPPVQDVAFGEIAFEEEPAPAPPVAAPAAPAFTAAPAFEATAAFEAPAEEAFEPLAEPAFTAPEPPVAPAFVAEPAPAAAAPVAPAAATPPAALTEEQLKAAIAGLSKDVIERIVWEVVPDLAEALIRDAIRKIKEGV